MVEEGRHIFVADLAEDGTPLFYARAARSDKATINCSQLAGSNVNTNTMITSAHALNRPSVVVIATRVWLVFD
jgi:hypothetical protein